MVNPMDRPLRAFQVSVNPVAERCTKSMSIIPGRSYFVYTCTIHKEGEDPYVVRHRYQDFLFFRHCLREKFPGIAIPLLPEKMRWKKQTAQFVEERSKSLQMFLSKIMGHTILSQCETTLLFLKTNEGKSFQELQKKMSKELQSRSQFHVIKVYEQLFPHFYENDHFRDFDSGVVISRFHSIKTYLGNCLEKLHEMQKSVEVLDNYGFVCTQSMGDFVSVLEQLTQHENSNFLERVDSWTSQRIDLSDTMESNIKGHESIVSEIVLFFDTVIKEEISNVLSYLEVFDSYEKYASSYSKSYSSMLSSQRKSMVDVSNLSKHESAVQNEKQSKKLLFSISSVILEFEYWNIVSFRLEQYHRILSETYRNLTKRYQEFAESWTYAILQTECCQEQVYISTCPEKLQEPFMKRAEMCFDVSALGNSIVFGMFHQDEQIGFCRAVSDSVSVAFLTDLYILPEHRDQLCNWFIRCILGHPSMKHLKQELVIKVPSEYLQEFKSLNVNQDNNSLFIVPLSV